MSRSEHRRNVAEIHVDYSPEYPRIQHQIHIFFRELCYLNVGVEISEGHYPAKSVLLTQAVFDCFLLY